MPRGPGLGIGLVGLHTAQGLQLAAELGILTMELSKLPQKGSILPGELIHAKQHLIQTRLQRGTPRRASRRGLWTRWRPSRQLSMSLPTT